MTEIVRIVNDVARALFHASAAGDEQLLECATLADLAAVMVANVDAVNGAAGDGDWLPVPVAASAWALDDRLRDAGGGHLLSWTTGTGRLAIAAEQPERPAVAGYAWKLTMTAVAGPAFCGGSGRAVMTAAWRAVDDVVVTCDVEDLDSGLIAEKPERVALLRRCAQAAGLDLPRALTAALDTAVAHAVAIDTLRRQSAALLDVAGPPLPQPTYFEPTYFEPTAEVDHPEPGGHPR
jgi:hypothetical protein